MMLLPPKYYSNFRCKTREEWLKGAYVFPANNLSAAAAKYILHGMHAREHQPLLLRSKHYIHPEDPMCKK